MSTQPDDQQSQPDSSDEATFDLPATLENGGRKVLAESAAELQGKLESEIDARKTERFIWILAAGIADRLWSWEDIIALIDKSEFDAVQTKRQAILQMSQSN